MMCLRHCEEARLRATARTAVVLAPVWDTPIDSRMFDMTATDLGCDYLHLQLCLCMCTGVMAGAVNVQLSLGGEYLRVRSGAYTQPRSRSNGSNARLLSSIRPQVNPDLRLVGSENVFAAGDISDVKEEKLAYRAERHAGVIAGNIRALAKDPKVAYLALGSTGRWAC